ncbi:unnamed protein product [Ilex paraguariensis]|uniref:Uncharacterized protein n=1 Tax=Ilex paraguariensis TaxID=185542 RepID=A0ABC8R4V9_9AQUA
MDSFSKKLGLEKKMALKLSAITKHEEDFHFMDKEEPGKDASEDMTRESLIAISYPVAGKDLALGHSPEDSNIANVVEGINGDGDEKYRSKLISISYQPSPDIKALSVRPGELKG